MMAFIEQKGYLLKKKQKTKSWDDILLTKFVVYSCFFIVFWDIGIKIKPRGLQLLNLLWKKGDFGNSIVFMVQL